MSNPNIQNKGFRSFYKELLQGRDYYSLDTDKTYLENLSDLRQKAFMENTCAFLYKRAEETFGLDYAEKLVSLVVNGDISITQIERYPFPEFRSLETSIFTLDYVGQYAFYKPNIKDMNHIQFFAEIEHLIMDQIRYGRSVNIVDFSLSLGLYFQRAVTLAKFGLAEINNTRDRVNLFNQLIIRLIHTFSVPASECDQPVTFSILDSLAYSRMIRNRRFSESVNKATRDLKHHAGFDYDLYLKSIQIFLRAFFAIGRFHKSYKTPKVRVYLACTDRKTKEFLQAVERLCGCLRSTAEEAFIHMHVDDKLDTSSKEFNDAIDYCLSLAGNRKRLQALPKEEIIKALNNILKKELSEENRFVVVDEELEQLIYSEKFCPSHIEIIYYKPRKGIHFLPAISETSINYKYLSEGSKGLEDFKERLRDAYIDAQTINQLRRKIIAPRTDLVTEQRMKDRLNVKITNIDDDMFNIVYETVSKINKELTETYGDCFTFEIVKPIYMSEKFSKYYLM